MAHNHRGPVIADFTLERVTLYRPNGVNKQEIKIPLA